MSIPLGQAQRYAAKIVEWLTPFCERIEIAGSIRRERPHCNDVDIVAIPKREVIRDLVGPTGSRNLLWEHLYNHVASGQAKFQSGGNQPGKFAILQLAKCQLDVYFAEPENFASRFLCRTGSKEHNVWIAERAAERALKWEPYIGMKSVPLSGNGDDAPAYFETETEKEIYKLLGLELIEPQNREQDWIRKHLEFGLP